VTSKPDFKVMVILLVFMQLRGFAASAGVWLRAIETEISAAQWALVAREGL